MKRGLMESAKLEFDALVAGRWHRRAAGGPGSGRPGLQGGRRGKGCLHRRQDDPAVQGLSHPGLRQLHHHSQDGRGRSPSQHHALHLLRAAMRLTRRGRRLVASDDAEAAIRGSGEVHRLPAVRIRVPGLCPGRGTGRLLRPQGHLHPLLQRHPPDSALIDPENCILMRQVRQGLPHRGGELFSGARRIRHPRANRPSWPPVSS